VDRLPQVASTSIEDEVTCRHWIIPHKAPAGGTGSLGAALDCEHNPFKKFLKVLGPGLVTGASDDDPSGIGTYAVAGASLGFAMLWLAPFTFPLMAAVQFTCAKIGMVTGRGLAGVLRQHFPCPLLYAAFSACSWPTPLMPAQI
jgi:hypothetical protein